MNAWVAVCWLLLGVALAYVANSRKNKVPGGLKPFDAVPGPRAWPLVGNVLQILTYAPILQAHLAFHDWALQYGPLFKLHLPGLATGRWIILSDPNLISSVMAKPSLPKSPIYDLFWPLVSPTHYQSMFSDNVESPRWRVLRKHISPFFSTNQIRSKLPVTQEKALLLCKKLQEFGPETEIETQDAMKRTTLDIFMPAAGFGPAMGALEFDESFPLLEDLHFCMEEASQCFMNPLRRPVFTWLPFLPAAKRYHFHHNRLHATWASLWRTTMTQPTPHEDDVSLGATLRNLLAENGSIFTIKDMEAEAAGLVLAGLDTSAQTLAFTLMSLAANPKVQERLASELDAAGLLATPQAPSPRAVTYSDLSQLPYLDAVMKESMRIFPVAATGSARITTEPTELGGYLLPSGTSIQVMFYSLHMLPQHFPEPERFMPERWIRQDSKGSAEGDGKLSKAFKDADADVPHVNDSSSAPLKYRFQPFSHGARDCPGQRLALMEVAVILAVVIGRFKLELAERMGGWSGCCKNQTNQFTLSIHNGTWLHYIPRAV